MKHPDRAYLRANGRTSSRREQELGRTCLGCEHWTPVPKGTLGLCIECKASTQPAQICDHYFPRGTREVDST